MAILAAVTFANTILLFVFYQWIRFLEQELLSRITKALSVVAELSKMQAEHEKMHIEFIDEMQAIMAGKKVEK